MITILFFSFLASAWSIPYLPATSKFHYLNLVKKLSEGKWYPSRSRRNQVYSWLQCWLLIEPDIWGLYTILQRLLYGGLQDLIPIPRRWNNFRHLHKLALSRFWSIVSIRSFLSPAVSTLTLHLPWVSLYPTVTCSSRNINISGCYKS